jgi:hypothetical protein
MATSIAIMSAFIPGSRQIQKVHTETSTADPAARGVYQPTMIRTAAIRDSANSTSVSGPGQSRAPEIRAVATASRRISSATPAPRLGNVPKSRCILNSERNATYIAMEVVTALGFLPGSHFVYCAEVKPPAQQDRGGVHNTMRPRQASGYYVGDLQNANEAWPSWRLWLRINRQLSAGSETKIRFPSLSRQVPLVSTGSAVPAGDRNKAPHGAPVFERAVPQ